MHLPLLGATTTMPPLYQCPGNNLLKKKSSMYICDVTFIKFALTYETKLLEHIKISSYPMSGYSQARARITRLKRGIPVLWRWLKHALAGMMRSRSFSICLLVINASLLDAFTISLYSISDEHFF